MNMEEKVSLDFFFINHEPDPCPINYSVYLLDWCESNRIFWMSYLLSSELLCHVFKIPKMNSEASITIFSFFCSFSSITLIHKRNRLSYILGLLTVFSIKPLQHKKNINYRDWSVETLFSWTMKSTRWNRFKEKHVWY